MKKKVSLFLAAALALSACLMFRKKPDRATLDPLEHMPKEAALAYAQLIEDGLAGKVSLAYSDAPGAYNDLSIIDPHTHWDKTFTVEGYSGRYTTTRQYAILFDGGEDIPYLCIFDEDDRRSFTIFGWNGAKVVLTANVENGTGRWETTLSGMCEPFDGGFLLECNGSGGNSRGGSQHRFRRGGLECTYIWSETYDPQTNRMIREECGEKCLCDPRYVNIADLAIDGKKYTLQEMEIQLQNCAIWRGL